MTLCMTAKEVRQLERRGSVWTAYRPDDARILGQRVPVREPWFRLRTPPGSADFGSPRFIRQSEARAEPMRFRYFPAETMPDEAVRRYVRVTEIGPNGCMCVLDRSGKTRTQTEGGYHVQTDQGEGAGPAATYEIERFPGGPRPVRAAKGTDSGRPLIQACKES